MLTVRMALTYCKQSKVKAAYIFDDLR